LSLALHTRCSARGVDWPSLLEASTRDCIFSKPTAN
jgi:hypothetical protein